MPQNNKKSFCNWTEKHAKFAVKYQLATVCREVWEWLLSLGKEGVKIEFSLQEFQEYITKHRGKPRTFSWVRKEFNKLVFLRIVSIDKDFGHNTYRAEIRHPDDVKPKIRKERNLHYHHVSEEKMPSNDSQSVTGSNSSSLSDNNENQSLHTDNALGNNSDDETQDLETIDEKEKKRRLAIIQLCAKYGILFNPTKVTTEQLYKYTYWEVQQTLHVYEHRSQTSPIKNPQGWLLRCLKWKYYEDFYYTYEQFTTDVSNTFFTNLLTNQQVVT